MKALICITFLLASATLTAFGQQPKAAPANPLLIASFYDHVAKALHSPKKTAPVGSHTTGNDFNALPSEPAVLVGIAVKKGDWFGTPIISALQPIYESSTRRFRGDVVGKKVDDLSLVAEAKPGYAVTQVIVSAPHDHVHGIKLVFRKIDFLHQGMDEKDSYESDWLGIAYQSKSQRVGEATHPAIGLVGRADEWVAAIGLLQAP